MRQFARLCLSMAVMTSMLFSSFIPAALAGSRAPVVTAQPAGSAGPDVRGYMHDPGIEPRMSREALIQLLRRRIKYVFVIFNENQSFDNEFGTFPGVNGLYSDGQEHRSAAGTSGFTQTYTDISNGVSVTVQPFRIGPDQNANVADSVDHSHTGLATKIDVVNGTAQMDKFAYEEYYRFAKKGGAANDAKGKQYARLVMSHIDCDTIPFFWTWASNFTIFDNIFATEDTPSAPNAVAMIAGQSGETQWVKHGTAGQTYTVNGQTGITGGVPLMNDAQPFYGSQFDNTPAADRQPAGANEYYGGITHNNVETNLTFASVPLTLQGDAITSVMAQNLNPAFDLPDIRQDIPFIQDAGLDPIGWRWYQEGYDLESTDIGGVASHLAYVSHHNGAQYFGYLADTPPLRSDFRGMTDFFTDMANNALPHGGVFYIRGGYINQMGLLPAITNAATPQAEIAAIYAAKIGDDDHPAYADRQISEAMAARVINAIAANPKIWNQCAIIITYDESDGHYDHVPPRILSYGPDGLPLARGVRVPLILISPYARVHAVSHAEGDHNAIIETINDIFARPALSNLPDEAKALKAGDSPAFNQYGPPGFEQKYLGPRDINSPITDSLLSGFDPLRLTGALPPLPASLATIPDSVVYTLPHYGGNGCRAIGIVPEDVRLGIANHIPEGFNPLPSTYPAAN
ncbi:MAG: hypothetical protein M0Z58_03390 [Nitrospiraceae bacterium]|nr:hypothetical protein [Nitrospiraceae bacterium]